MHMVMQKNTSMVKSIINLKLQVIILRFYLMLSLLFFIKQNLSLTLKKILIFKKITKIDSKNSKYNFLMNFF